MPILTSSIPILFGVDRPAASPALLRRWPRRTPGVVSACKEGSKLEQSIRRKCSPLQESSVHLGASTAMTCGWRAVPDIWRSSAEKYGDRVALRDPYHEPPSELTYKQLEQEILNFSEGLRVIGAVPEEKLALFADNSCRWLVADQGIMSTGAISVVRGTRSSNEELLEIYNHSESVSLILDNAEFYNRIAESFISHVYIRFIILLWGEKLHLKSEALNGVPVYTYKEILEVGHYNREILINSYKNGEHVTCEIISPDEVATLMYTSGTSGTPKGVMLTHKNLLHQINNLWDCVPAVAGDRFLSMLPTWHAYERATEYFIFTHGIEQIYTNVKNLKDDLRHYQPHYLISVPLVYQTLYSSIQKQISTASAARKVLAQSLIKISLSYMEAKRAHEGKMLSDKNDQHHSFGNFSDWLWALLVATVLWPLHKIGMLLVYRKIHCSIGISKAGISGGASLPMHVDRFFEAIGVKVQNGYGLTETSPVVAARRPFCNVLGTVGHPLPHTGIKITHEETGEVLPDGSRGIIKIKGPLVMKGYYKNPSATEEVLDENGWLNTGDIGWIVPTNCVGSNRLCGGMLVHEGRAKETIVLLTGENVDPSELEGAAMRSSLIQQIVVVGQDQRRLGALIVPNKDEIIVAAKKKGLINDETELSKDVVMELLCNEVRTYISDCTFQIGPILIIDEPFTIENGLMTPTMKLKRSKIVTRFSEQIAELYN